MSNPIADPTLVQWQPDATGADSNLPQAQTPISTGTSGELAGELRAIKSVVRGIGINMSWEIWKGVFSTTLPSTPITFTVIDANNFSVNDNFTVGSGRGVAQLGRRVQATIGSNTIVGTITNATFTSPNTTVTVTWDSGALSTPLSNIYFGVRTDAVPPVNISAVTLSGDVIGPSANCVVDGIQATPVASTTPVAGQVLGFDGSQWTPAYTSSNGTPLVNRTGVALTQGDVVTADTANNSSVTLADTLASQKQMVVATQSIASLSSGLFVKDGIGLLNVTGAVTRGHYLYKSASSLLAQDSGVAQGNSTAIPNGVFAVALTAAIGPGAGQVLAEFLGVTYTRPSGSGNNFVMFDGGVNKINRTSDVGFSNVDISANIGADIAVIAIIQCRLDIAVSNTAGVSAGNGSCRAQFRKGGSIETTILANIETGAELSGSLAGFPNGLRCIETGMYYVPVDSSFIFQYNLVSTVDANMAVLINQFKVDLMGYVY